MRERRLVFGEVADLYDRHRPAYPARLIDDLVALTGLDGSRAVLEVGAGTGKATLMFAARDIPVLGVEPSPEMALVARRNCAAYPRVHIEQIDFEHWDPGGRRFPLLFSAQAWHWVQPAAGYAKARQAIAPEGLIAPFWNRVVWTRSDARETLLDAYERTVPGLQADGPMHPANISPDAGEDWENEIAEAVGFEGPEERHYDWSQDYSTDDYIGLLATISEVRLLDDVARTALLGAVSAAIDAQGGLLSLPMRTRLCLARRT